MCEINRWTVTVTWNKVRDLGFKLLFIKGLGYSQQAKMQCIFGKDTLFLCLLRNFYTHHCTVIVCNISLDAAVFPLLFHLPTLCMEIF